LLNLVSGTASREII